MSLVTTKDLMLDAQKNHYAIGAFNAENMEMVQAIIAAAEELRAPVIVQTTLGLGLAILNASGLSFLGLGVEAPMPEWGSMLAAARGDMRNYPYLVTFPGIAIVLVVLALNMVGDGLRDALDPRMKN